MRLGFLSMNTDEELNPRELAMTLEVRGFNSVWFGEHTHIPICRSSPFPPGGSLPRAYTRMMSPIVSLSMAAAVTTKLRIGTAVSLALQHDPILLAKDAASLDLQSGGRFTLGVGLGWNKEEFAGHRQLPWADRYSALEEFVGVLRALWRDDVAVFDGEYFQLIPSWAYPKPVQAGGLPIALGARGPRAVRSAARWADIWLPSTFGPGSIPQQLQLLRHELELVDRDPRDIDVKILCANDPSKDDLESYRDMGISEVIVGAGSAPLIDRDTAMRYIDTYAEMVDKIRE
jgi:probable F420-dependent oxidoreductase